jgi:hypothetical protein
MDTLINVTGRLATPWTRATRTARTRSRRRQVPAPITGGSR